MRLNKIIQRDYTSFSLYYQIKLPLDLEISIPSDDPVRLVSAFVEEMDLSELYKTYGRIKMCIRDSLVDNILLDARALNSFLYNFRS